MPAHVPVEAVHELLWVGELAAGDELCELGEASSCARGERW
jgi:hypothetical protein